MQKVSGENPLRIPTSDLRILIRTVLCVVEPGGFLVLFVPLPHLPGWDTRVSPSSKPLLVWGRGCRGSRGSSGGPGGWGWRPTELLWAGALGSAVPTRANSVSWTGI